MNKMIRAGAAALLAATLLGGCSASAGIDTTDKGVKVSGDVDAKNP